MLYKVPYRNCDELKRYIAHDDVDGVEYAERQENGGFAMAQAGRDEVAVIRQ